MQLGKGQLVNVLHCSQRQIGSVSINWSRQRALKIKYVRNTFSFMRRFIKIVPHLMISFISIKERIAFSGYNGLNGLYKVNAKRHMAVSYLNFLWKWANEKSTLKPLVRFESGQLWFKQRYKARDTLSLHNIPKMPFLYGKLLCQKLEKPFKHCHITFTYGSRHLQALLGRLIKIVACIHA